MIRKGTRVRVINVNGRTDNSWIGKVGKVINYSVFLGERLYLCDIEGSPYYGLTGFLRSELEREDGKTDGYY